MPHGDPHPALGESLAPVLAEPSSTALMFDIDGTLAPIVTNAQDAHVPTEVSVALGRMCSRFALVACVSGRGAAEARRIVGVGGAAYAGAHGAELLMPGATKPELAATIAAEQPRVQAFLAAWDQPELRRLRLRIEDKGFIVAFHWRGAPDEAAAEALAEQIAEDAEGRGLKIHRGRKVLEVRPSVAFDKGQAVNRLVRESHARVAMYVGDDNTDLDAFAALRELVNANQLELAVCVGVNSAEAPPELAAMSDLCLDGPAGVKHLLQLLAG